MNLGRYLSRGANGGTEGASTLSDEEKHRIAQRARDRLKASGSLETEREAQRDIRARVSEGLKVA
jgi:hypothetical protein